MAKRWKYSFEADNKGSLDKDEQSDNDEQWSLDNRALSKPH